MIVRHIGQKKLERSFSGKTVVVTTRQQTNTEVLKIVSRCQAVSSYVQLLYTVFSYFAKGSRALEVVQCT